jgi:hypothetical protein
VRHSPGRSGIAQGGHAADQMAPPLITHREDAS